MKSLGEISIEAARQIAVNRQFRFEGHSKSSLLNIIDRLGYIQIDTISIVERSHNHILWSRSDDYSPSMLDNLLENEKAIYEYWSHAASYLPMSNYRFSLPRMKAYSKKYKDWGSNNKKLIRSIIGRIRSEGPLSSREFEGKTKSPSGWWNHKPAKQALEYLFHCGKLMVASRRNFAKVYDLPENVIPSYILTVEPSRTEFLKHLISVSVDAHGVISDKEIVYLRDKTDKHYMQAVNELLEDGTINTVTVRSVKGESFRTKESFLNTIAKAGPRVSRILSPFDNITIRRNRLKKLFDFDYTLECYVPAPRRKFGYFCLPVLIGTKFAGTVDCKSHKREGIFEVKSIHPNGISRNKFLNEIEKSILKLAKFSGCGEIMINDSAVRN